MGRINAEDTSNNGLLIRSLFGNWPTENLAQIFSGGSNGDLGFLKYYYVLSKNDRHFGSLFFQLKDNVLEQGNKPSDFSSLEVNKLTLVGYFRNLGKQLVMDSGLYELIFSPKISKEMQLWVENFNPDLIYAQGYNIAFTLFPLMLAKRFHIPLVFSAGDDWPNNRYRPELSKSKLVSLVARYAIITSSRKLIQISTLGIANCQYMREEYIKRYSKEFVVLMMGGDFQQAESIQPKRLADPNEIWIVSTGVFNHSRLPLLIDLDQACGLLKSKGYKIRATIFSVNSPTSFYLNINDFHNIEFQPCPNHYDLEAFLRGADILFLPERFDKTAKEIMLSISTKAHLFMFSGKPIVVYSDPITGIARYAREEGWAIVIDHRDPFLVAQTFENLITDSNERLKLITCAHQVAMKNHHLPTIQNTFFSLLCSAVSNYQEAH